MKSKYTSGLLVIIVLAVGSCETGSSSNNSSGNRSTVSNLRTPDATPETPKKDVTADENAKMSAINAYLEKNHKGWHLEGIGGFGPACIEDDPCDLNLKKGGQDKIITIIVKEFFRIDGSSYLYVYEPTKTTISQYKRTREIESAQETGREEGREEALTHLTMDDCQVVFDDMRDASYEPPDGY